MKHISKTISIFLIMIGSVAAHPHVYIDVQWRLILDGDELSAIAFSWTYDLMTSAQIACNLSAQGMEIGEESNEYFLRNFKETFQPDNFHTHINIDGKAIPILSIENFSNTKLDDQKVRFNFEIPIDFKIDKKIDLVISTIDNKNYYAMLPETNRLEYEIKAFKINVRIENEFTHHITIIRK